MAATKWTPETVVPPLQRLDGTSLSPEETAELLELLQNELPASARSTFENPNPAQPWRRAALAERLRVSVDSLRERCGEQRLDAWMAALLRSWLQDIGTGTARKFPWVVPTAALLGGDACAALMGAHLRGENHSLRCTGEVGVEALVEIGTRGALLELAHLARKFPSKLRGEGAHRALQAIAAKQGLTPERLQDRILPDCGIDATGRRSFDYGPRQFELLLDEHLTPLLRAADGRRLTSLPKPNSKDDATRAAEAREAWKLAKNQIAQTARSLAARFETAMISGETWSVAEFNEYFRRHPLARHVVRRLLWTAQLGGTSALFRVAEDDTLADCNDAPLDLRSDATHIRPVHPLELASNVLETWQRLFAEYQILSPFPQLDRPIFELRPEQATLTALAPLPEARFEAKAVVFPLENRGWLREQYADGGMLTRHTREFRRHGVTASLEYEPGAFLGDLLGSGPQRLTKLYFLATKKRAQPLTLGAVPPIVFSETLRDIHALVPAN